MEYNYSGEKKPKIKCQNDGEVILFNSLFNIILCLLPISFYDVVFTDLTTATDAMNLRIQEIWLPMQHHRAKECICERSLTLLSFMNEKKESRKETSAFTSQHWSGRKLNAQASIFFPLYFRKYLNISWLIFIFILTFTQLLLSLVSRGLKFRC